MLAPVVLAMRRMSSFFTRLYRQIYHQSAAAAAASREHEHATGFPVFPRMRNTFGLRRDHDSVNISVLVGARAVPESILDNFGNKQPPYPHAPLPYPGGKSPPTA